MSKYRFALWPASTHNSVPWALLWPASTHKTLPWLLSTHDSRRPEIVRLQASYPGYRHLLTLFFRCWLIESICTGLLYSHCTLSESPRSKGKPNGISSSNSSDSDFHSCYPQSTEKGQNSANFLRISGVFTELAYRFLGAGSKSFLRTRKWATQLITLSWCSEYSLGNESPSPTSTFCIRHPLSGASLQNC